MQQRTVMAELDDAARRYADREALVDLASGRRWTYAELLAEVRLLGRGLLASGVRPGDRVGLLAAGGADRVLVPLAAAGTGAVLVPLDPALGAEELCGVVRDTGVSTLLVGAEVADSRGDEIRSECPSLIQLRTVAGRDWKGFRDGAHQVTPARLTELQATLDPRDTAAIRPAADGSTVSLSQDDLTSAGRDLAEQLRCRESDVLCLPTPFLDELGTSLALASLTRGACLVSPGASAAEVLTAVREERCTILSGEAAGLVELLDLADRDDSPTRDLLAPVRAAVLPEQPEPGLADRLAEVRVTPVGPGVEITRPIG